MKKILISISIVLFVFSGQAQDYFGKDKANYVFGFARLLNWSQYYEGQVVVNVLGETPVFDYLNVLSNKNSVSGRKLVTNRITRTNQIDCNILYLSENNTHLLSEIIANSKNKSVLIITETPRMTGLGADVSFAKKFSAVGDSVLTYTYNLESIKSKNIKIAIEFIGYGTQ